MVWVCLGQLWVCLGQCKALMYSIVTMESNLNRFDQYWKRETNIVFFFKFYNRVVRVVHEAFSSPCATHCIHTHGTGQETQFCFVLQMKTFITLMQLKICFHWMILLSLHSKLLFHQSPTRHSDHTVTQWLPLWRCSHCSVVPDTVTTEQWLHRTHTL